MPGDEDVAASFLASLAALDEAEAASSDQTAAADDGHVDHTQVPASESPRTPNDDNLDTTATTNAEDTTPRSHDSSSSAEGTVAASGKRAPMRNVSRERKRAELTTLREEADALERQRNLLLLKRKHQAELVPAPPPTDPWQRVAEAERVTRERAENENERLVTMLQQQAGLSRTLESLLRKRVRRSTSSDADDDGDVNGELHRNLVRSAQSARVNYDTSMSMLHAQFSRDIQRVYKAGIGRIFTGRDWTAANAELGRAVVREEKIDEITGSRMVEMRETRHVPFEYARVADAMWRCALQPFAEHGRVIESYGSPDDQIAIKYRAATPGNEDRGDLLTALMVLQKFEEPDRTVHVWRLMSSSTDELVSETQRAFSDETGWIVIEPVPAGVPGLEPDTAVVRMVGQLVPLWSHGMGSTVSGKLKADDFHDLVVEASCEDMVALGDAVGSLLLDDSLGLTTDLRLV